MSDIDLSSSGGKVIVQIVLVLVLVVFYVGCSEGCDGRGGGGAVFVGGFVGK